MGRLGPHSLALTQTGIEPAALASALAYGAGRDAKSGRGGLNLGFQFLGFGRHGTGL